MTTRRPTPSLARALTAALVGGLVGAACDAPEPAHLETPMQVIPAAPADACRRDPAVTRAVRFDRSPGGVPEVDADWLRDEHCNVRVIDVREAEELAGPLGALPFGEHVPLGALAERATDWNPEQPVVLVCRSGRRSARGVRMLEDQGFARVASMTGGMLHWRDRGFAVRRRRPEGPARRRLPVVPADGPLTREAIAAHLGDPSRIRWVKVAALLMQGTQSCVDGRDPRPVVGTPGGDAGELLLALAALERVRGEPLDVARVPSLLDAYLDAFGRFYVHTDDHALHAIGEDLRADPRFAPHLAAHDEDALERLVRRPPRDLEGPLLAALSEPTHVGCGHLRLILSNAEEYGVRPELTRALLRSVFVRLWRGDAIDFVILEGEHREGAVVNVVLDGAVHPFTRIPTVAPRLGSRELFVNHPQVSAWLREQNATFFFEEDPWLHAHPERQREFLATLESMGEAQLGATLAHLASTLPVYTAHVSERAIRVEGPAAGTGEGGAR
ncbi:MAG TPA: rhodanese-like domain-containing protein [Sandaracinaceae bacterium LLY-WYZ-13_1]|nr:rhodanese-like domain-containing protein [Sandaracinaceae bacterium LLY-WYZ-13_1]